MGNFEVGKENVYKVYTGLADVKVIAVNPTKDELNALGVNIQSEPNYVDKSEEGNDKCRIDFWLHEEKLNIKTKVSFFIENKLNVVSQAGNMQFINDLGQSAWGKSIEEVKTDERYTKWLKHINLRPAIPGEVNLIEFIKAWLSIGRDAVAKIDNVVSLAKGDMSELKPLVKQYSDRKVQVLLGTREGYQAVFSRYFSRAGNRKLEYWIKNLDGSQFNYQNSFQLQELSIQGVEGATSTDEPESTNNPWANPA